MKIQMFPFCLLQHMVQPKEKSTFLLSSNSHILDHTCRSMVPIKFSHQQYRVQMLPNYYHVLPHTVCYIQYHFWYHIHQFSTYFMYKFIIRFGIFLVVVSYYGRTFKQYFIKICKDLKITLCVLYKVNHKGNKFENINILPTKHRQYMARTESIKKF